MLKYISTMTRRNGCNGANGSVKKPVFDVSVPLAPNNIGSVPGLVKLITALGAVEDEESRRSMLDNARSLVRALETPRETMIMHCWAQVGCMGHHPSTPRLTYLAAGSIRSLDCGHKHRSLRCSCRARWESKGGSRSSRKAERRRPAH